MTKRAGVKDEVGEQHIIRSRWGSSIIRTKPPERAPRGGGALSVQSCVVRILFFSFPPPDGSQHGTRVYQHGTRVYQHGTRVGVLGNRAIEVRHKLGQPGRVDDRAVPHVQLVRQHLPMCRR
jgi:hypothetical protein